MPIIIIYFLFNNLNYSQIGTLAAVMATIAVATEMHGGIFADRYGRKLSLELHAVFGFLTMLLYFIGDSFFYFLIASILYGLAGAFITGTKNSILFDTLRKLKMTKDFKKYNGRLLFYSHFFNAIVLLFIPLVYSYNVKYPFIIGMAFFVAAFLTAAAMKEPPSIKVEKISFFYRKILEVFKEVVTTARLCM